MGEGAPFLYPRGGRSSLFTGVKALPRLLGCGDVKGRLLLVFLTLGEAALARRGTGLPAALPTRRMRGCTRCPPFLGGAAGEVEGRARERRPGVSLFLLRPAPALGVEGVLRSLLLLSTAERGLRVGAIPASSLLTAAFLDGGEKMSVELGGRSGTWLRPLEWNTVWLNSSFSTCKTLFGV